jgi:hypothetical protein
MSLISFISFRLLHGHERNISICASLQAFMLSRLNQICSISTAAVLKGAQPRVRLPRARDDWLVSAMCYICVPRYLQDRSRLASGPLWRYATEGLVGRLGEMVCNYVVAHRGRPFDTPGSAQDTAQTTCLFFPDQLNVRSIFQTTKMYREKEWNAANTIV